jgi:formyltetrahydrofolate deformylase
VFVLSDCAIHDTPPFRAFPCLPWTNLLVLAMPVTLLKLSCPDRVGLLAQLTAFVAEWGGNLDEVHQFTDAQAGWFFTRMAIETPTLRLPVSELHAKFAPLAEELGAQWSIRQESDKMRVVLMVSKLGHCLADLLWRWRAGELGCDIAAVIGNHEDLRDAVEREGIPFHYVPVNAHNKTAAFAEIESYWNATRADLIVLARYMQIIPAELCRWWEGKILNIHHSFLPSFVGANPYQRAWERGVKLIGATCHYVTADLDEGPIVEQEVIRAEHFHSYEDLLRLGRDCERQALARGVRWHLADRVLMHGSRTVVFRD